MTKSFAIGIDIGGTKTSIVVGNHSGHIFEAHAQLTQTGASTKQGISELVKLLKGISASPKFKNKIAGIGIGLPGPVDSKKGTVPFSPNLNGWKGLELKRIVQTSVKLPVFMANDANAAAVGEKIFGQGRGVADFVYMTVSTGVGGGIFINHQLVEGGSFVAGEVGHMKVVPGGNPCKCGMFGCLEAYASGTAIAKLAKENLSAKQIEKILKMTGAENLSAKVLGKAIKFGEKSPLPMYEQAGAYLGVGIANLLNILNPEKVILGGGVFKSAPKEFWNAMLKTCQRDAWPEAFKFVKIVRSTLVHVGDLGAMALVFQYAKKK